MVTTGQHRHPEYVLVGGLGTPSINEVFEDKAVEIGRFKR